MERILGLWRHRALIVSFVKRDLLVRYNGSAVGLFWSVIHPLIMLVVYAFVFSTILKVRVGASEGAFSCPECQMEAPGYDRQSSRWRHLETRRFTTWIEVDVPRIAC